jgi:hypothetical protein
MKLELSDSVKNKKVDVRVNFGNDTSASENIMAALLGDFLKGPINIELSMYILANTDSSKIFFESNDGSKTEGQKGVNVNISTPDTFYYKEGNWRKLGGTGPVTLVSLVLIETGEKKKILGYECIKFVSSDSTGKENVVIWASKELPGTLIPYTGLKEFKYGILEIDNIKNQSHTMATKVKRL